ncbi:hypothetical protein PtrSN002B_010194 [Pyrenophora tritici-repentis]|uniref:Uncharacterized protein n=2 Tax=Pyrenophora tritici-repentis TaxID=45151 RepID=A0A2W1FUQ3_9PLEO|nr:uncharacterized protein PTRG_05176 [Pyrenophora tritici-repentis Pt-1C-BFP]KAA8611660.1 hypothetical protein PtrV1_13536 [Pyrenophora tritici-repentis]EDU48083.1 predicted protein [Pyrenophora tritici-repentis Pt-1C-BFP]KAF7447439.1 hypothetical protein A1F99_088860 [Pyrenophora tritici-repentis]KAF7569807.1 hypothetical protein PtrM4_122220 [Pyrenophora tritici-repentis]KAI0569877.1 hypothetical protein Alg130_11457 [Pyrenophora tritici-repentis]
MAASNSSMEGNDSILYISNMIWKDSFMQFSPTRFDSLKIVKSKVVDFLAYLHGNLTQAKQAISSAQTCEDQAKDRLKKMYLELLRLKSTKGLDQTTKSALSTFGKDIEKILQDLSDANLHLHCATGYVTSADDTTQPHHHNDTEGQNSQDNKNSKDDAKAGRKRKVTDDESDGAKKGKHKRLNLSLRHGKGVGDDDVTG